MDNAVIDQLRRRYDEAEQRYADCCAKISAQLERNTTPSDDELLEEKTARRQLTDPRRQLFDVLTLLQTKH